MDSLELEINLYRSEGTVTDSPFAVGLRGRRPGSAAGVRSGAGTAVFDFAALQKLEANPTRYGTALSEALFADPQVLEAFTAARTSAESLGLPLRLRLLVGEGAARLHGLRWETLRDPQDGSPLAANANLPFSRYLGSPDWRPVELRSQGRMCALLAASNPADLAAYNLAAVDAAAELDRVQAALGEMEITRLPDGSRRTSLENILAHLQQEPCDLLYLICHGAWVQEDTWLWLEGEDGNTARTSGRELAERLKSLARRPVLVVLASCETADGRAQGSLSALAPRLVDAGIPAVLAMQTRVGLETLGELMPVFFEQLNEHGQIDQALSAGRARVLDRPDFWAPALFTRLEDGCIWEQPASGEPGSQTHLANIESHVNVGKAGGQADINGVEINATTVIIQHLTTSGLLDAQTKKQPELPGDDSLPEPGALPAGYRMQLSRNENFTGRQDDLLAAWRVLKPGEANQPVAALALTGMGGVGKTQVAVEYCHRYGQFYAGVHWLAANQNLEAEIAACGFAMGIKPWPEKQAEQVRDTLLAWQGGGRRLVVLDTVEDEQVIADWTARLGNASILFTTRQLEWAEGSGVSVRRLGLLGRSESLELLRKLAQHLDKVEDAELDRVAERLGDLPLAVDLAGRFFKDNPDLTADDYLEELSEGEGGLEHTSLSDWVKGNPTRHATSLAATFLMSWQKLAGEEDEMARLIFLGCGICAPNTPIPLTVVEASQGAVEKSERRVVGRALRRLYGLGLLEPGEDGPAIHTLLGEYARQLDSQMEYHGLLSMASGLGRAAQEANESELPANFTPLLAHVETAIPWAEAAQAEDTAYLLNGLGSYYWIMAEYKLARIAYTRSLEIEEDIYGPQDPIVAISLNNLASILHELDELDAARALYERALAIDEAAQGPQHPDVGRDLNNLGSLLKDLGELDAARVLYERSLAIDELAHGPRAPQVAVDVNNLGNLLQELGDLDGAKALYERALSIDEEVFGSQHPNAARGLNNIGSVLHQLGDLAEAQEMYEKALAINTQAYGPQHPAVASDLHSIGSLLLASGDLEGARDYLEKSLKIISHFLPAEHSSVKLVQRNLDTALRAMGGNK